jgi:GT2 family glycosyltransferase
MHDRRVADVRLAIVSWNTADLLGRCLDALPAALGALDAEVIVVDNASTDGSAEVAAARPGVRVMRNDSNIGYARAMNQGLAGSDAPVLIALNPDTEPPPGSLQSLVETLRRHPSAGLVAPRLLNADGTVQHSVYRFPSLAVAFAVGLPKGLHRAVGRRFWLEGHAPHDQAGPVDWAIGAVHCIRAEALPSPQPYDERSFMYVEDMDLCWRLHQAGWQVWFEPAVAIPHVANAAGAQAWGDDRTARWLHPTYQWYARTRGRFAARSWAAVNAGVLVVKLVFARAGLLLRLPRRHARAVWAAELRRWLGLHGRKLIGGPDAPLLPDQRSGEISSR